MKRLGTAVLALLTAALASAEVPHLYSADPLRDSDRAAHASHLVWEPVGQDAKRLDKPRGGRVRLAAGEDALFALPAQGHLRLQSDVSATPPQLWLSTDGQLWRRAQWTPGTEAREWFHVEDRPTPSHARLHGETAFDGRLLIAGEQRIDAPATYRELPLPLEPVHLTDTDGARVNAYRLPAGQVVEVTVAGPTVLALALRPAAAPAPGDSRSGYGLDWAFDSSPWQRLALQRPSLVHSYQELGACALHGDMDRRFLVVPEGRHRLQLRAPLPLLLNVGQTDTQAYFLADNEPAPTRDARTRSLLDTPRTPVGEPALADLDALRQSNAIDGAADIVLARLAPRPGVEQPRAQRELAGRIEREQRFFRPLFPDDSAGPVLSQAAWFSPAEPPRAADGPVHYLEGDGVLERLSRGVFVAVGTRPLRFPLPARVGPSRLRLTVALPDERAADAASLWVQYDAQPSQRLALTPAPGVAELASPPDAVLSRLGATVPPALSGGFATSRTPGHYWRTANVELPLPETVKSLRVWSDGALKLALQYRASEPYAMSEFAYRALLKDAASRMPLVGQLHEALRAVADVASPLLTRAATPERALANQWYPMLRQLHAAQAVYLDEFDPGNPAPTTRNRQARLRTARPAAARADWLRVLEALGPLGYGQDAEAYRLSQQALEMLGEPNLARHQRRAVAIFGGDPRARAQATDDLMREYGKVQDWDSQIQLLAAVFLRTGDASLLEPLGGALQASGASLWATQLGLVLAQQGDTPAWLYQAARDAGWGDVADLASAQRSPAEGALLRGDRAERLGQTGEALAQWRRAEAPGTQRAARLHAARAIAAALKSTDPELRQAAIERWLVWAQDAEQTFAWAPLTDQVTQAAGYATLFSETTRKPLALPRATPDTPVELEVIGPVVLRVQARRLVPGTDSDGRDWLVAEVGGKTLRYPLVRRPQSPYLVPIDGGAPPSIGDTVLLDVPPGLQRLRLRPQRHAHLLAVAQWRPREHWAVLPPPTPLALRALLAAPGNADVSAAPASMSANYQAVADCRLEPRPILPAQQIYTFDLAQTASSPDPQPVASLQALRFPAQAVRPPELPLGNHAVDVDAAAAENPDQPPVGAEAAYHRAVALLWLLDTDPDRHRRVRAQIAQLAQAHADVPALAQLRDQALQGSTWEPIGSSFASAGIRRLPVPDTSHSPFRRARRALSTDAATGALSLHGRTVEGVEFHRPVPATVTLQLRQQVLPYERQPPAEVMVQVDDELPQRIAVRAAPTSVRLRIDAGDHALRLWLKDPLQQQFVTAQFDAATAQALQADDAARIFHVAALSQPASFHLQGPAWVRIDEWRPEGVATDYRYVASGWQELALAAGPGGEDRYYRLHVLKAAGDDAPLASWVAKARLPVPAEGPAPPPPSVAPSAWQPRDSHAPGAGFTSLGGFLALAQRGDGDGDEDSTAVRSHRLIEAGISYRARPDPRLYSRSDLLIRQLDHDQTVLGMRQWLDFYPAHSPWRLQLFGSAFVQPTQVPGLNESDPWSAYLQGTVARDFALSPRWTNEAGVTINQRWLSLDSVSTPTLAELDPDIYSVYKRDHRRSLMLADRLTWRPWLDRRWYLEGALVSNEELNPVDPDHWRATAAAGQLFGPVAAEAGVRGRYYLSDDDRERSALRTRLFLRANWLRWGRDAGATTLGSELNYDIDSDTIRWELTIGWGANNGGLSPALRPDEIDFLPQRRALQRDGVDTNRLDPVYP
ncbi:MAG: hypothetical protein AB7I68_07825 [Porticoccaceae bacterium]